MTDYQPRVPGYFQQSGDEFFFSVGEVVYGTLTLKGDVVRYHFNDGGRPYTEDRKFPTRRKAEIFASRFAAEMRRADRRNAVPHMGTFRGFD